LGESESPKVGKVRKKLQFVRQEGKISLFFLDFTDFRTFPTFGLKKFNLLLTSPGLINIPQSAFRLAHFSRYLS
jgi:hypothetical protein